MPETDAVTALLILEASWTDLPELTQDQWFISQGLLTINLTYGETRQGILEWRLKANSIWQQEARDRLKERIATVIKEDLFVAVVNELNGK